MTSDINAEVTVNSDGARLNGSARIISNFALQHLKAATFFRDRTRDIETQNESQQSGDFYSDIRSYASACILSTAASLEALINELFISHQCRLRALLSDFENEFWGKGKIKEKIFYRSTSSPWI